MTATATACSWEVCRKAPASLLNLESLRFLLTQFWVAQGGPSAQNCNKPKAERFSGRAFEAYRFVVSKFSESIAKHFASRLRRSEAFLSWAE